MTDEENAFGSGSFGGQQGAVTPNSVKRLIDNCLIATNINTDETLYRERVLTFLNFLYLQKIAGRHWKFQHRELFLQTKAPYIAGTVALNQGNDIVEEDVDVGNGATAATAWNSSMVGQMFAPTQGDQDFYRILKVETAKKLQLESPFSGESATFSAYRILFDRLTLEAAVQGLVSVAIVGRGEIKMVGRQEFFYKKHMDPDREGVPQICTLINQEEDSGQWTLELYPAPDKRYTVHIQFMLRAVALEDSETSFTMIPPEYAHVLYTAAVAEIYRLQENPAMLADARREATMAWNTFASDQEMTDSVARIQPGRSYFNRLRHRRGYYGFSWFGKVD